jgi:hypothetical protein
MDTITTTKAAIAEHLRIWGAYVSRQADIQKASSAYSHADNVFNPGSPEYRSAEQALASAKHGLSAVRETLRTASAALLKEAHAIAAEHNQLWEIVEPLARDQWRKFSVGAKLYNAADRERDFHASPWRQALPHVRRYEEYPTAVDSLPSIGPEFSRDVQESLNRLLQLRTAVAAVKAIKL